MSKKTHVANPESKGAMLGILVLSIIVAYGFASWAIDSGSWWQYLLAFVGVYYSVSYLKKFTSAVIFNNDKKSNNKSKARKS